MKLRVQLFAVARQLAARDSVELELPEPATIADVRRQLASAVPALQGMIGHVAFAVDADYAGESTLVRPGAEVACIPPVSGG